MKEEKQGDIWLCRREINVKWHWNIRNEGFQVKWFWLVRKINSLPEKDDYGICSWADNGGISDRKMRDGLIRKLSQRLSWVYTHYASRTSVALRLAAVLEHCISPCSSHLLPLPRGSSQEVSLHLFVSVL